MAAHVWQWIRRARREFPPRRAKSGHGTAGPAADQLLVTKWIASASDKSKADGSASTAVDFDCGHCHGHCAGMLDFPAGLKAHAVGSAPPRLAEAPSAEHLPAQLERPQWACLA